jgi:hypothetical protein
MANGHKDGRRAKCPVGGYKPFNRKRPSIHEGGQVAEYTTSYTSEQELYEDKVAEVKRLFGEAAPEVSRETLRMTHEEAFYAGIWW